MPVRSSSKSSKAPPRAARGWRRWTARVVVSAFIASAVPAAPMPVSAAQTAAPATAQHGGRPHQQQIWRPRPVTGLKSTAPVMGPVARGAARSGAAVSEQPAHPAWPTPTQADVDLSAAARSSATAQRPAAGSAAKTQLDVAVAGADASSPSKVRVNVLDHAAAVAAGADGVIATVARADGSTAAGRAQITIDYGSWAQAFGGEFADRLALVALPACALTTPAVAKCRVQSPLKSVNDRAHHKLTATVTLPAGPASHRSPNTAATTATAAAPAMVLAATASASGANGTYAASPLKASDAWSVSGNAGSFDWQYPLSTPASLGSTGPSLGLGYDSGSVDGRTTVSNGQPSDVGEGFELGGASSFIETAYKPCAKVDPTNWASSGDMCLGVANATISGGAHAGDLVRDDTDTTKWRLSVDDGTRVQLLTGTIGGSNNTANQAYWKLTGTDGTVYLYGANRLPAAYGGTGIDNPTYSTWSEPVFGTGSGTSCNDPTGTEDAQTCLQAWRWNLDYVIDPHGNVTRLTYARELDNYQHKTATTGYTRSGFLREIDYGWQQADVAASTGLLADGTAAAAWPASTVRFVYAPRCLPSTTGCPTSAVTVTGGVANTGITTGNATAFSDVPYDQHCAAGSTSCAVDSPAYFSTVRLTAAQTAVNNGAAMPNQPSWTPTNYEAVDAYTFTQSFPSPQDYSTTGNRAQLRLDSISRTGYVTNSDGTLASTPEPTVNLGYTGTLPNRAQASSLYNTAQFYRFRLNDITDGLGAETIVTYGQPNSLGCGTTAPPATTANATLCFPEYFNNNGTMVIDWFNKYLATGVTVNDDTVKGTGFLYSAPHTTNYTYIGSPAWHTNDSEQADPKYRTVDAFRGFRQVQTTTSGEATGHNAKSVTTYFQGMDQDPTAYVCLNDSHNQAPATAACPSGGYRDDNALMGQALEVQTYASETSTSVLSDVISVPEDPTDAGMVTAVHTRASGLPAQRAHFSHVQKQITYAPLASGALRRSEIDYTYDNSLPVFTGGGGVGGNGHLILTDDKGDTTGSGAPNGDVQELCTFTGYAGNTALGADGAQWTAFPMTAIVSTVPAGQSCTTTSETTATTVSETQTLYDNQPPGTVAKGDATTSEAAPSFNATWVITAQHSYDQYGRVLSDTDADGHATQTTYNPSNPSSRILPKQIATKNPAGWTTTKTLDRGRGLTETTLDANNRQSDAIFDGLGRVTQVWTTDHGKASNPSSPTAAFSYGMFGATPGSPNPAANAYVESQTLREDGSYGVTVAVLDGFGDAVETQATPADGSGGLVSTQTEYNSLGKAWRTAAAHWDSANAPSGTFHNYGDALPAQTVTTYDGLSRPLTVAQYHNGAAVPGAVATTAYPGVDRTDQTAAAGNGVAAAGATSTVTDVRGKPTALWTYHNSPPTPTGNSADADVTTYGFSFVPNGTVSTTTDGTTKNTWTTTTTDLLGQHVTKSDPDAGTSYTLSDPAGLVTQTQDARGQYLSYYYDALNRETAEYNAPWTASGTPSASRLLAGWAYDTAPGSDGKSTRGLPLSSTRYTDSGTNKYVSAVTGYDAAGRSLGDKVTIPPADGNSSLAGSYQTNNTYTPVTGLLDHTDLPAAGGLPAETVYNSYNVNGLLLATGGNADYVVDTQYDQLGRVLSRTLGDYPYQTVQQNLYDAATGRVTNTFIDATAGQNPANPSQLNTYSVDDSSYTYDAAGRLTSAADLQNWTVSGTYNPGSAARDLQCYTYDYAGRLTNAWADKGDQTPSATSNLSSPTTATGGLGSCADSTANNAPTSASVLGGPAPYWQTYGFDSTGAAGLGNGALTGNRSSVTDHDITGHTANDVTRTSAYPAAGTTNTARAATTGGTGPHLLASVTAAGGVTGTDTYTYDGAGNTTSRVVNTQGAAGNANETLTWDAEDHLATDANTATNTTASFVYDASGNTLIRRDYTTGSQNGTVTLYLGSAELHLTTSNGAVSGQRYYDYPCAPGIIADSTGKLTYEITNAQSTGGTTVNAATGQVTARRYFKPYGDPRGTQATSWPDDHTFLGKSADASTGLVDVGARKYDPTIGRFVSADPVFQLTNPQAIGGYAYAANDPVNLTDPTGLDPGEYGTGTGGTAPDCTVGCTVGEANGNGPTANGCVVGKSNNCGGISANSLKTTIAKKTKHAKALKNFLVELHDCQTVAGLGLAGCEQLAVRNFALMDGQISLMDAFAEILSGLPIALLGGGELGELGESGASGEAEGETGETALASLEREYAGLIGKDWGGQAIDASVSGEIAATEGEIATDNTMLGCLTGGQSFTADTPVLTASGKAVPIAELKVGDKVQAFDTATGKKTVETVDAVLVNHDTDLYDLTVHTPHGKYTVHTTSSHLIWSPTTHTWITAGKLTVGEPLLTADATAATAAGGTTPPDSQGWMWDLTVHTDHDFYVVAGDTPVLVHNAGPGCGVLPAGYTPNVDEAGLNHSFDRHAAQWFGGQPTRTANMGEWQGLVERTARSSQVVPWSSGSTQTYAYLSRIDGKWFTAQFDRSSGNLVTAFVPNSGQVGAMLDLLGK